MTKDMKYKVGDRVRVRSGLKNNKMYGDQVFVKNMEQYKGKEVTILKHDNGYYKIKEDEEYWSWTDEMFEGLVEDKLTAEEAIRLKSKMCENTLCSECKFCKRNNGEDIFCSEFSQKHPEQVIEVLKQWKKDHEKKEIETEIVDLIKVMKEVYDDETCIYAYEIDTNEEDVDEKMNELVKQYYEKNGGIIYAKFERICRVKS